ncbi:MAG: fimbrial protein pilin [uncultured bacterium (gcode 4)]|uniref:Fimbrial protein pilin n=1 Tax=uncultured bacterium (gcode 4) TaxID=1234023 RepID=K2FX25_9BACT|nr:MAG: fimbrial protein pilin [uncultured bacterium (gcode 4)]
MSKTNKVRYLNFHNSYNKAFTLVELIVVITILAILWVIAFLSYNSYTLNTRDSQRISDLWLISKSLETYISKVWKYPTPSNSSSITYSWSLVWTQWTFWKTTQQILNSINPLPIDPLYAVEYAYSVLNTWKEFEIAWILESADNIAYMDSKEFIANKFYNKSIAAWSKNVQAYLIWNYNWIVAKVQTWSEIYLLALPSIISWDISLISIESMLLSWWNNLVLNKTSNIPSTYADKDLIMTWSYTTPLTIGNFIVWSWTWMPSTTTDAKNFIQNIKTAYSWSTIQPTSNISWIVWTSDLNILTQNWSDILWNEFWIKIVASSLLAAYDPLITYTVWQSFSFNWDPVTVIWSWIGETPSSWFSICGNDIVIFSWANIQTWASCNLWATTRYTNQSLALANVTVSWWPTPTQKTYMWAYYQWWRNDDVTTWSVTWTLAASWTLSNWVWHSNFIINASWPDWVWGENDDLWWNTTNTLIARKWPCPTWYHIPSWWNLVATTDWWKAYLIAWNNFNNVRTKIMLPNAGKRKIQDGTYVFQNSYWIYWSSSVSASNNYSYDVYVWWASGNEAYPRGEGFSVRCIKN